MVSQCLEASKIIGNCRPLRTGAAKNIASGFGCSTSTVFRIWKRAQDNQQAKGTLTATPPKYDDTAMAEEIKTIPLSKQGTMRSLAHQLGAHQLGVPMTMVWRKANDKEDPIVPHSSAMKPILTDHNKYMRYCYAMDWVIVEREAVPNEPNKVGVAIRGWCPP